MKNKDTLLVDKSKIKSSLEIDWDLKMKELIKCIDLEFENNQNNIFNSVIEIDSEKKDKQNFIYNKFLA